VELPVRSHVYWARLGAQEGRLGQTLLGAQGALRGFERGQEFAMFTQGDGCNDGFGWQGRALISVNAAEAAAAAAAAAAAGDADDVGSGADGDNWCR